MADRGEQSTSKRDLMKRTPIPPTVLEKHLAIVGKTGSGKTNTAKLAVEQAFDAGARVCILDPIKSDWWGITSSADGKHAGMPFQILGGPRGHVPLHEQAGAAIGQLVGEGKLRHSIVDMADFGPGGHQRFFIDFAQALFRHASGVVYLVVEEAHIFAPKERAGIGQENLAIHWMSKIASAARSKGVRLIVCTQRTQKLHNDALGSCDTIIAHRLVLPADQKPIVDWLKNNTDPATLKKIVSSLASLRTGQGWICSGELGIVEQQSFPLIRTFDNSKTPSGDAAAIDVATAQVDLAALRAIVGEAVKEAEANDPKKLKARIAELELQLTDRIENEFEEQSETVGSDVMDDLASAQAERDRLRAENAGLVDENMELRSALSNEAIDRRELIQRLQFLCSRVIAHNAEMVPWAERARSDLAAMDKRDTPQAPSQHGAVESSPVPNVSPQNGTLARGRDEDRGPQPRAGGGGNRAAAPKGTDDLPKGERTTLTAIVQHGSCTRSQLSILTGYKRSTRNLYLQQLKQKGYIAGDDPVEPTAAGRSALGSVPRLPTGDRLREHWLQQLPAGEANVLRAVCAVYPKPLDREVISNQCNYSRSTRNLYIQQLQARKLVASTKSGVRAADLLFDRRAS
jgi:hypothetical protein